MTNQAMIDKIANALSENTFVHPGDEKRGLKPRPIILPFKAQAGMPKEMADLMSETTKLLAECIIASIEEDCEITPKKDARALRRAAGKGDPNPLATPVFCQCNATEPLMYLTITDPESITVFGPALVEAIHGRAVKCPHDKVER
jgi:hypothetical protein